jgi:hypothetical protein
LHFLGGKAALGKAKFVELAVISSSFLAVLEDAGALIEGCAEVEFDRTEFEDTFGGCRQWRESVRSLKAVNLRDCLGRSTLCSLPWKRSW